MSYHSPDLDRFLREQEEIPDEIEAKCDRHYQEACAHLIPDFAEPRDLAFAVGAFYQTVWRGESLDALIGSKKCDFCPDADFVLGLAGQRWKSWWQVLHDLERKHYTKRVFVSELFGICVRWNVESYAKLRTMEFLKVLSSANVDERNGITNNYWDRFGRYYKEDCLFHIQQIREYDYEAMFLGHAELVAKLRGRTRRLRERNNAGSAAMEG